MIVDIHLPGNEEVLSKVQVLMDSGANGCAYISSTCYEKFSSMIPTSALKPVRSLTSFGGKETQASKFEVVLCLRGEHRGIPVTVSLPFLVLDTDRFEVILGTKAMGRSKALNDITVQMVRDLYDEQQQEDDEIPMLRFLSTEEGPEDGNNLPAGAGENQAAPAVPPAAESVGAETQPDAPDMVPAVAPTPVVPAVALTPEVPTVSIPTSVPTDVSAPPELSMVSDLGSTQVPVVATQVTTQVPAPLAAAVPTPAVPSSSAQMSLPQVPSLAPQPGGSRLAKPAKVPKPAAVPVSSVAVQTPRAMLPVLILNTSRGWVQLPARVVSQQVRDQLFDHPAVFQLPPGEGVDSHRDALVIFLRVLGFSIQNSHHLCLYAYLYAVFLNQYDNGEHSNQAPPGANVNINGFFTLGKQWRWCAWPLIKPRLKSTADHKDHPACERCERESMDETCFWSPGPLGPHLPPIPGARTPVPPTPGAPTSFLPFSQRLFCISRGNVAS